MFGNSPTVEQLALGAVLSLYIFVFKSHEKFNQKLYYIHHSLFQKITETREEFHQELSEIKQVLARIDKRHKV